MNDRVEPRRISIPIVRAIHADQARQHGGARGIRDPALLESALERCRTRWTYDPAADLCEIAAAIGFGVARNHPFLDGNKRVAFQTMYVFLGLNGLRVESSEADVVTIMLRVASGEATEEELATWLRHHTTPR